MTDQVNHPQHYTSHPSGIECIQITEHMGFNIGNAVKYCWRADLKGDGNIDLEKAIWYLQRELARRTPKPPGPFSQIASPGPLVAVVPTIPKVELPELDE